MAKSSCIFTDTFITSRGKRIFSMWNANAASQLEVCLSQISLQLVYEIMWFRTMFINIIMYSCILIKWSYLIDRFA